MPEIEVITKHLTDLTEYLEHLNKYSGLDADKIAGNKDFIWMMERGIFLCIQNLLDIFAHILAADFNQKWESYSEIAVKLYEKKIISSEQKDILIKMAGFRNRLSHDYLSLDNETLADIVNYRLKDFYIFINIITNYCEKDS